MKTKLTIIAFLIALASIAQNGINYKALIKDTNGNILNTQGIDMVFSIQYEGNTIYSELQQIVTDNNGIAIATIGEGSSITGVFDTITWDIGNLDLNVQIDFGDGLVDFGTSKFNLVPYAIEVINKDGLISTNEGTGTGWRLEGVITDGDEGYGSIGNNATDLSVSNANGLNLIYPYGATGTGSFATGRNTVAFGDYSTALGHGTIASENYTTTMGFLTQASGLYATAMGRSTNANAIYSTAIGSYNLGGGNPSTWNSTDPIFEIGNGSSASNRSNALTVLKNGFHRIISSVTGLRIESGSDGIYIDSPGSDGITVVQPAQNGLNIFFAQSDAIFISESSENGMVIQDTNDNGIVINNANGNGITIQNINDDGIHVEDADGFGGHFEGQVAGMRATSSNSSNPDIILGANSQSNDGDDGIISTATAFPSSDMYLRSNDAIILELDDDNNEAGTFIIRNSADDNVFTVNESGVVRINGSVIHNSDRRLKTNIESLGYGLKEVLQLEPKAYFWKGQDRLKKSLGLIAQDVASIIPEIVNSKDDKQQTLGVSYTELIPILINAIKEQNDIIKVQSDALKRSNKNYEALLSRIEDLEAKQSN